jgi:Zn-dependent peptidase ImmA (M78 family)
LDADEPEPTISFQGPDGDLREVRANAFASAFLVPPESIKHLDPNLLSEDAFLDLCNRLMVNTQTLIIAFKNFNGVSENVLSRFSHLRVRRLNKPDPELGPDLTSTSRERRQRLLEKGISFQYVRLCFDAHREGVISLPRLAEVLLLDLGETLKLMASFKEVPQYAH